MYALFAVLGLAIAGFGILMEESQTWQTQNSLIFFAFCLPLLFLIHYFCWRWNLFEVIVRSPSLPSTKCLKTRIQ